MHPKYKTQYRVTNWPEYERALTQRGDITVWLSPAAIKAWNTKPSGRRGAPRRYSSLAIETALALRLVYHLPLRQTEDSLNSLIEMMGLDFSAPDHTTLSRRSQQLNMRLRRVSTKDAIHLIVDSSGLSIVDEGEWAAAKYCKQGKRGWKKLHIGVDESGVIAAQELTDSTGDDASAGLRLIDSVKGGIKSFIGDAAYDTLAIYDAAGSRGARVVVPPFKTAVVSKRGPRSRAGDRTIRRVKKVGRRRWKKESGYHRQGTVESPSSGTNRSWEIDFAPVIPMRKDLRPLSRALCSTGYSNSGVQGLGLSLPEFARVGRGSTRMRVLQQCHDAARILDLLQ